jgi:hypothetical protein
MTGGAGDTFAIVRGDITTANQPAAVKFTIDPSHFTLPGGRLALGIDVVPATGSNAKPLIVSVDDPQGKIVPQTFHSIYDPHVPRNSVALGVGTSAVITPVQVIHKNPTAPVTYTVNVAGVNNTTGGFLLGFYLPGDANGDGVVNQADIAIVKSELGSRSGDQRYNFDADVNRDGRIGLIDLHYTQHNLGASTTITPVVSANLDPSSQLGVQPGLTAKSVVKYTGNASPGASITFSNTSSPSAAPVTATADAQGNYAMNVPLVPGSNTFRVTTQDAFGQSISGTISPVTYYTPSKLTPAQIAAMTTQQPSITVKPQS